MSNYNACNSECGSCYWFRDRFIDNKLFEGPEYEKGYCKQLKSFFYPNDSICSNYNDKNDYVPGTGCYITTIVCDLLGYGDKCDSLNTLRSFRDNIMQNNEKYKDLLFEYDTVGPVIASNLLEDEEYDLAGGLFDYYILPATELIKKREYDKAVEKYTVMTKQLEKYYGLSYDCKIPSNYDINNGGHGKVLTKGSV